MLLGYAMLKEFIKKSGLIIAATVLFGTTAQASTLLYSQNFENPNPGSFVNDFQPSGSVGLGDVNIINPVNLLYGGQPSGFAFAQRFSVETLLVNGGNAWGTGFLDPQGRAGRYTLGMLSDLQDDLLGLAFNVGANRFLNFQLDISSVDLDHWGGPFVPAGGQAPRFKISLYDNPSGTAGVFGSTLLSSVTVEGAVSSLKNTFNWTNQIVALDAFGNTNGNVIVQIDLVQGGYAALDNFRIVASDDEGDVGGSVPLPGTLMLLACGLLGFVYQRK